MNVQRPSFWNFIFGLRVCFQFLLFPFILPLMVFTSEKVTDDVTCITAVRFIELNGLILSLYMMSLHCIVKVKLYSSGEDSF